MDKPFLHAVGVYPRVGGGTEAVARFDQLETGLSPRGRGNPGHWLGRLSRHGSIPAWAGEPLPCSAVGTRPWVYPRVGGGTRSTLSASAGLSGLSPRGRGNRGNAKRCIPCAGSIPAWAGEPAPPSRWPPKPKVYPRVGGGTLAPPRCGLWRRGLSPRGRGNPRWQQVRQQAERSIPAWAGEPACPVPRRSDARVYPRVGGGTDVYFYDTTNHYGLSPRGRGNRSIPLPHGHWRGSIPAWAGEPGSSSVRV